MNTKILAAPALIGVSPVSTAAFADTEIFARPESLVLNELKQEGITADRVEEWGNYVLAFVTNDDGTTSLMLLDGETYAPANQLAGQR
jgi:hypothetical protein